MFDGLRKRLADLLTHEPAGAPTPRDRPASRARGPAAPASRDANRPESRLILTERIHNRAAVLLSEVRHDLFEEISHRLEDETAEQTLYSLLEVMLDTAFTVKLDESISEMTSSLLARVSEEISDEPAAQALLPKQDLIVQRLASYRDEVLRRHMLEQIEVRALPTTAEAFALEHDGTGALDKSLTQYWSSCRDALEQFFRSVEMILLDSARDGIHLDPRLIRERLVAAQYRNGYRLLTGRLVDLLAQTPVEDDDFGSEDDRRREVDFIDRRIVDDVIVPLAYFIRERAEPEPRAALAGRAKLFREIIDKCVAIRTPMTHITEAVKPVLRKSISQVRPLVLKEHSYLRTIVESLKPAAIHRTTALLTVFETLVEPELDETSLAGLEQIVRLNRPQYRLHQAMGGRFPDTLEAMGPLDRVDPEDSELLTELIEPSDVREPLVQDLFLRLGYLSWPDIETADPRTLLRLVGVVALSPHELCAWPPLHADADMSAEDRSRLAELLVDRLDVELNGGVDLLARLQAVPVSVDIAQALDGAGFRPEDDDRLDAFKQDVLRDIVDGSEDSLRRAVGRVRSLATAVHDVRVARGATLADGDPYLAEIWNGSDGSMVGLVHCRVEGMGKSPVEVIRRGSRGGPDGEQAVELLTRQLQSQAVLYQKFHGLFAKDVELSKEKRQQLPSFVKKLYEPTEPHRHLMMSRFRYARELIELIESFAVLVEEADLESSELVSEVRQILDGLARKVTELSDQTEKSKATDELARTLKEYERALKYLNAVVGHSVNPWLARQTADLSIEFEFKKQEVVEAVRLHAAQRGIDWERDVDTFEAHGIKGTLGCRALVRFTDGTSKVVLLNFDRKQSVWKVRYLGPRITDIVRDALRRHGKQLPNDYDEKFEQPTFSLDEQSCRFFLMKRERARVEATLVLPTDRDHLWEVVYLKFNDEVLIDRSV